MAVFVHVVLVFETRAVVLAAEQERQRHAELFPITNVNNTLQNTQTHQVSTNSFASLSSNHSELFCVRPRAFALFVFFFILAFFVDWLAVLVHCYHEATVQVLQQPENGTWK